jgi:hypothetical protein
MNNREVDIWTMTLLGYVESRRGVAAPAARALWADGWLVEDIAQAGLVPVETVQDWLNFRE